MTDLTRAFAQGMVGGMVLGAYLGIVLTLMALNWLASRRSK